MPPAQSYEHAGSRRGASGACTEDGLIAINPCTIRGAGAERVAERRIPTVDQVFDLAAAVPTRYRALVLLAAFSGLRRGELSTMPRSIQEILDHADELAQRFEDYEPSADDEVEVAEHLLRRAALARARTEHQIAEAVVAARAAGLSWKRIGKQLGTSAQAAQQRYGSFVEAP